MTVMAVNHELKFSYPEGFHVMDAEERSKLNIVGEGEFECLSDPERHIIFTVGWKRMGGLAAALTGAQGSARAMEKKISEPMTTFNPTCRPRRCRRLNCPLTLPKKLSGGVRCTPTRRLTPKF